VLQLRDYGRVDLRITDDGHVYVLEVNPNPNLAREDEIAQASGRVGIEYPKLIDGILRSALRRAGR
jgi:D-alanine-D-alanine ligase